MNLVLQFWTDIAPLCEVSAPGIQGALSGIDYVSVAGLQLMCPEAPSDLQAITTKLKNGRIFPQATGHQMSEIKAKIQTAGYLLIPTLASLFGNLIFLAEGAKVIKRLINTPISRSALKNPTIEQRCERSFFGDVSNFRAAYLKLWQFALQHFEPTKSRSLKANRLPVDFRWRQFALYAHALGYESPLIEELQKRSAHAYIIASTFLDQHTDTPREEDVRAIANILSKYDLVIPPPRRSRQHFYTNSGSIPQSDRYGSIKESYAFDPCTSIPRPGKEHDGITGMFSHVSTFHKFLGSGKFGQLEDFMEISAPPSPTRSQQPSPSRSPPHQPSPSHSPPQQPSPPRAPLPRRRKRDPTQSPQLPSHETPPLPSSQALVVHRPHTPISSWQNAFRVKYFDGSGQTLTRVDWVSKRKLEDFVQEQYEKRHLQTLMVYRVEIGTGKRVAVTVSGNRALINEAVKHAINDQRSVRIYDNKTKKPKMDDEGQSGEPIDEVL